MFLNKLFSTIKYRIIKTYVVYFLITITLILGGVYYFSTITIKKITKTNLLTKIDRFYKDLTIEQKNLEAQEISVDQIQKKMEKFLLSQIELEEKEIPITITVISPTDVNLNHFELKNSPLETTENKVITATYDSSNNFWNEIDKNLEDGYEFVYINTTYNLLGEIYKIRFLIAMTEYELYIEKLEFIYKFAIVISIFLSILGGSQLSKEILIPLRKINKTAKNITSKSLNERIPVGTNEDELSELITIINSMIERLEDSFGKQKKFVSDASHELRTPLLVINGYAELLEEWGLEDKDIALEAIKNIKSEGSSMKKIIEDLLFLAREDNESLDLKWEQISIKESFEKLQRDYSMLEKEIDISSENFEIQGDKKLFLQMLRAILDNSFKFSKGKVLLEAIKNDSEVRISIKDFGVGIPKDKIASIFGRFIKLDDHRNRNKGGTGLGLSIVHEIIKRHNWEIKVDSEVDQGTTMTIIIKEDRKNV